MKNNEKGFSLLEVIVAMAIVMGTSFAVMKGFDSLNVLKSISNEKSSIESILMSQLDEIRSNIVNEKIDFKADAFLSLNTFETVNTSLVMRWNQNGIYKASDCTQCKGRIGYVIEPYKVGTLVFRGLFLVTIRVTHSEIFKNRYRQYSYIVRGK